MREAIYAPEKPEECRNCFFWKNSRIGCGLGQENCYYLISVPEKPKSECDGCPYGRAKPCIGWCTKQLMRELCVR